jgi:hypothetical protein
VLTLPPLLRKSNFSLFVKNPLRRVFAFLHPAFVWVHCFTGADIVYWHRHRADTNANAKVEGRVILSKATKSARDENNMELKSTQHLLALCTFVATTVAATGASAFTGLYVFGDSLSASGNNAALFGAQGQTVTKNRYIATFAYASGTYSNRPVWVNSFAAGLGWAWPVLLHRRVLVAVTTRMAVPKPTSTGHLARH